MSTDPRPASEPLSLRSHVATVMCAMAVVLALGSWVSWLIAKGCDASSFECQPGPPAVDMLLGLGLTFSIALLVGSLLMWSTLTRRVKEPPVLPIPRSRSAP